MIIHGLSRRQGSMRQWETEGGGGKDDVGGSRAHGVDTRSDTQKTSPLRQVMISSVSNTKQRLT